MSVAKSLSTWACCTVEGGVSGFTTIGTGNGGVITMGVVGIGDIAVGADVAGVVILVPPVGSSIGSIGSGEGAGWGCVVLTSGVGGDTLIAIPSLSCTSCAVGRNKAHRL